MSGRLSTNSKRPATSCNTDPRGKYSSKLSLPCCCLPVPNLQRTRDIPQAATPQLPPQHSPITFRVGGIGNNSFYVASPPLCSLSLNSPLCCTVVFWVGLLFVSLPHGHSNSVACVVSQNLNDRVSFGAPGFGCSLSCSRVTDLSWLLCFVLLQVSGRRT